LPKLELEQSLEEDPPWDGNLRNLFKKEKDQKDKSYGKGECPIPLLEPIDSHQHKQTQYAHGHHTDNLYPIVENKQDRYAGNGNKGYTLVTRACCMMACLGAVIDQQHAQECKHKGDGIRKKTRFDRILGTFHGLHMKGDQPESQHHRKHKQKNAQIEIFCFPSII